MDVFDALAVFPPFDDVFLPGVEPVVEEAEDEDFVATLPGATGFFAPVLTELCFFSDFFSAGFGAVLSSGALG